mgnify:CR=1 FL=1
MKAKKQIERMDIFVETMRKMSSLDTRELVAEEITSKTGRNRRTGRDERV